MRLVMFTFAGSILNFSGAALFAYVIVTPGNQIGLALLAGGITGFIGTVAGLRIGRIGA